MDRERSQRMTAATTRTTSMKMPGTTLESFFINKPALLANNQPAFNYEIL